ncbi:MAG: hypothetical protein K2W33_01990, partial [Burkholderiales bacterium]|nr:hypothetical protein [Burkholderiales bacterium]
NPAVQAAPEVSAALAAAGALAAPGTPSQPTVVLWPDTASLQPLMRSLQLGHVRGVSRQLDALATTHPHCEAFVRQAKALLQDFRLDELERWVAKGHPLDADTGADCHDPG